MSNSYKFYSDTKDIMKKYVNATEGAIIYGISKSRIMVLASEAGENIEKRNEAYHTDTGNHFVYPVCSGTDLFSVLFRRIRKSSNGRKTVQI